MGTESTSRSQATCVYVAYGVEVLDLRWIPPSVEVVIVHNDERLRDVRGDAARVTHIQSATNVGFGAGVNLAVPRATGSRLVVVNPDTELTGEHWDALVDGDPLEIRTVPLVDKVGSPAVVMARHFTPVTLVASGLRLRQLHAADGSLVASSGRAPSARRPGACATGG